MDLNEYQDKAGRTEMSAAQSLGYVMQAPEGVGLLLKNALGLAGEAGETVEMIKKIVFHGRELEPEKLKKELGDVLWYVSQLARAAGISLEDIGVTNVEKLMQRYPEGYSHEASAARVDVQR